MGCLSKEKEIERLRQQSTMPEIYLTKQMIPDTPHEPDLEIVPAVEPKVIPSDDENQIGMLIDYSKANSLESPLPEVLKSPVINGTIPPVSSNFSPEQCLVKKTAKKIKQKPSQRTKKQKYNQLCSGILTGSNIKEPQSETISSPLNVNASRRTHSLSSKSCTVVKEVEELTSPLPDGWCLEIRHRPGKQSNKTDFYLYSPDGIKISSRLELAAYLKKNKSTLSVSDFYMKKVMHPEKIKEVQLPCKNDHSTEEDPEEQMPQEHQNVLTLKEASTTVDCKSNESDKSGLTEHLDHNSEILNKNGLTEHLIGDNKIPQIQVSPLRCAGISSDRPRRSIIRKSASELLKLPRRIKIKEENMNKEEEFKHSLGKEKLKSEESSSGISQTNHTENKISTRQKKTKNSSSSLMERSSNIRRKAATIVALQKRCEKITAGKLPDGWKTLVIKRKSGKTAGQPDVYILSPEGNKFRCKRDLAEFLKKTKSSHNLENFTFSRKFYL